MWKLSFLSAAVPLPDEGGLVSCQQGVLGAGLSGGGRRSGDSRQTWMGGGGWLWLGTAIPQGNGDHAPSKEQTQQCRQC